MLTGTAWRVGAFGRGVQRPSQHRWENRSEARVDGVWPALDLADSRLSSQSRGRVSGMLIIVLLWLMRTASAQNTVPESSGNGLLIVSAKKISGTGKTLDIKLQSGDHAHVPAEDANERATEIVRAALRSQSPRLHLTPPEHVVVLNVTALTEAAHHGRVTITLSSGATIQCRADDVRTDPHLVFLRTVLAEEISKARAARQAPAPSLQLDGKDADFRASINLDTKGADFRAWIKGMTTKVRSNWYIPYSSASHRGHTVVSLTVSRDGTITDVRLVASSGVDAFDKAALSALTSTNVLDPLPSGYPDNQLAFQVTFYYNEYPKRETPNAAPNAVFHRAHTRQLPVREKNEERTKRRGQPVHEIGSGPPPGWVPVPATRRAPV
jgi:TonB family protein